MIIVLYLFVFFIESFIHCHLFRIKKQAVFLRIRTEFPSTHADSSLMAAQCQAL